MSILDQQREGEAFQRGTKRWLSGRMHVVQPAAGDDDLGRISPTRFWLLIQIGVCLFVWTVIFLTVWSFLG